MISSSKKINSACVCLFDYFFVWLYSFMFIIISLGFPHDCRLEFFLLLIRDLFQVLCLQCSVKPWRPCCAHGGAFTLSGPEMRSFFENRSLYWERCNSIRNSVFTTFPNTFQGGKGLISSYSLFLQEYSHYSPQVHQSRVQEQVQTASSSRQEHSVHSDVGNTGRR